MIDLNQKIGIENLEIVIITDNGFIHMQESFEIYGIDYTILDKYLNELDGGIYEIGYKVVTFGDFFEYINYGISPIEFNKNSIIIDSIDLIEAIREIAMI